MAVYCDDLLMNGHPDAWAVSGVGLMEGDAAMRDALVPQDCLYNVISRDHSGSEVRVVGSIVEYIFAPEERERALARMTSPETRIVSVTVTEKGYGHNPATGDLDTANPAIAKDLASPGTPATAAGMIVEVTLIGRHRHCATLLCSTALTNTAHDTGLEPPESGRIGWLHGALVRQPPRKARPNPAALSGLPLDRSP